MNSGFQAGEKLGIRRLTAWIGAALVIGSAVGLVWIFDGFVPHRFIALNVPSIAIVGDCRALAYARVTYRFGNGISGPATRLRIDLERPDCDSLSVKVTDGHVELGYRSLSGIPALEGLAGDAGREDRRGAHFDLKRHRGRDWLSASIVLANPGSEALESFEGTTIVRRKAFAEYLAVGRTSLEFGPVSRGPDVAAAFAHEFEVTPHGASIVEEVPLSPDEGRSFLVGAVARQQVLGKDGYPGLVLEEKRNWHMQFRIVARDLQRRRDMLIVLFSTLIGVGVSALLESLLSAEIYRSLARLGTRLRPRKDPPEGPS